MRLVVGLGALLLTSTAVAETYMGRVVGISDGDTIKVLDDTKTQHKIRLAGIDAPEKTQPFGQRSKESLSDQIFGRDVTLECGKLDRYKREICVVLLAGNDVNLIQVKSGMAWWYRQYAKEQTSVRRHLYENAEQDAHAGRRGLWSDAEPTPPWQWRHVKKEAAFWSD